jgi:RNA polymerase-associated protein
MDYLDERFPHPPLMPIDPVTRAQFRVALYRVERDWYGLAQDIELDRESKTAAHSRKVLCEAICASAEVFKAKPFFLSDEFSLVDASIAPILWRLAFYGIELPPQAQPIVKYMNSIFARSTFRACLSVAEREMRH